MKIMGLYWFIVEEKQQLREAFNNGFITKVNSRKCMISTWI